MLAGPGAAILRFATSVALATVSNFWRPRQDSNLRSRLRRPMLYPLSYEGNG